MINKELIEYCYECLDKVVHYCQLSELNLKTSPPYILDSIPDIFETLKSIITSYSENYEALSNIEYFEIYVSTLVEKCHQMIDLFKKSKNNLDFDNQFKVCFIKLSFVFSNLLKELDAMFPNNIFIASNFRITKPDASHWWRSNFGSQNIVPYNIFLHALLNTFSPSFDVNLTLLKTIIDLTDDGFVSVFEFDVFTRLFQPWNNILRTWQTLVIFHPGFKAFMTYDDVKDLLNRFRYDPGPGSYVFRLSCTKLGQWTIGYISKNLKILQTLIKNKSLIKALTDGEKGGFYIYPDGRQISFPLSLYLKQSEFQTHLQVTQEQYLMYCEIGSSFELCKICDENDKNIQLEPCGHLICKTCFLHCQSLENGHTCPFCRLEIKDIEEIIIEPFRQRENSHTKVKSLLPEEGLLNDLLVPYGIAQQPLDRSLCDFSLEGKTLFDIFTDHDPLSIIYNLVTKYEHDSYYSSAFKTNAVVPVLNKPVDYAIIENSQFDSFVTINDTPSCSTCKLNPSGTLGQSISFTNNKEVLYTPLELNNSENNHIITSHSNISKSGSYRQIKEIEDPIKSESNQIKLLNTGLWNKSFEKNVNQLILLNENMAKHEAYLLLKLTNNHLQMSNKIWKYFMPRQAVNFN